MTGHSPASIKEECDELIEKLDWLRVGDKVVGYEILSRTIELYNEQTDGTHLSIERLILGLAVRRKVCRQIFEGHYDETVMRVLREIASGS
ncbi:hypothetical protein JCM19232_4000 [Vibrio ishigakensis]|nr:hypothetical protein JCM19232_4000 [Vibrio ishigakensis]